MTSRDTQAWMWAEACAFLERADRLHRQFFQLGTSAAQRPAWEPPMDVFETEREIWILVALPGVHSDHIQVIIDAGALIVTAERPIPNEAHGATICRLEIPHGRLARRIELPPGRFELGQRSLVNGCLFITLHKLEY